ncbi:6-bladed beta-propeller [Candidatus Poribacteria bacterium]|nr:6-bladed beta-propeller [Candidatus Poribacteria bacterium]
MKRISVLILAVIGGMCLYSCSQQKLDTSVIQDNARPYWSEKKKVSFVQKLQIGTEDVLQDDYLFGVPKDIKFDKNNNIYIADNAMFRIQKYSSEGKYLQSFGNGNGRGPGEFMSLRGIAVDSKQRLLALDFNQRNITIFDSSGEVVSTIKCKMKPLFMVVGSDDAIYVVGSARSHKRPLIHKFRSDGSFETAFCERKGIHEDSFKAGNAGYLSKDNQGNIYFAIPYPYEIRKFSPDGDLLQTFSRRVSFFQPPFEMEWHGQSLIVQPTGSKGLSVLPDGKLVHVIYNMKDDGFLEHFLDIFSSDGTFLYTLPLSGLTNYYDGISIDEQGGVFFIDPKPYPTIKKFTLNIE